MKVDAINKNVRMLIAKLRYYQDYNEYLDGSKRIIIVEGKTDKAFIEKLLNDNVVCKIANDAFGYDSMCSKEIRNNKQAIIMTVFGVSKIPVMLECFESIKDLEVYGMVDLDFDDSDRDMINTPRLFVTDTHDLETLLLSTDDSLLDNLEGCIISREDLKKALFISYQLGVTRTVLYNECIEDLDLRMISPGGKEEIEYSTFITDYKVNISKLLLYINSKNISSLSENKIKNITKKIFQNKSIKKRFNSDMLWNTNLEDFKPDKTIDLWKIVNGHEILSVLRYVNQSVFDKYHNRGTMMLNRSFEMDLINKYRYVEFEKTKICHNMISENIIKM